MSERVPNKLIPVLSVGDIERFWSKVSKGLHDSCWNWVGGTRDDDRGCFWCQGSSFHAPRVAFYLGKNQDPGKLLVCHTCNNPRCCNPSHLYAGTSLNNSQDSLKAGSQVRGESQGLSKLTESNVLEIRRLYRTGNWSQRGLGKHFGVSQHPIKEIIHGRTWKHV